MNVNILHEQELSGLFQADDDIPCIFQQIAIIKKRTITSFDFDLLLHLSKKFRAIEFHECIFESINIERQNEEIKDIDIELIFKQCEFKKFEIKEVCFHQNLQFFGCTFKDNVNLSRNTFTSLTIFFSIFNKELRMIKVECMNDLSFFENIMQERTILNNSNFAKSSFRLCNFEGLTKFINVTFNNKAIFEDSIFDGKTVFDHSRFKDDVNFGIATFNGETKFLGTIFDEEAKFQATTFGEKVFFDSAQFKKAAIFSTAKFLNESRFIGTKFHQEMNFSDIIFKNTHFSQAIFIKSAQFLNVVFDDLANFFQTNFQGEANFSGSLFKGVANFDQTRFSILPNFLRCTFCNQFNIDYKQIQFQEKISHPTNDDNMAWQDLFRKLKSNRIASHNIIESSEFRINELYIRETNLQNKEDKTPKEWIERWQLWLYRHTSDHHTDLLKIISWVLVAIGVFGLLLFACKYGTNLKTFIDNHSKNTFVALFDMPLITQNKIIMWIVYALGFFSLFWKWSRIAFFSSIALCMTLISYKYILGVGSFLTSKTSSNPIENLLLVLYTLVMILLLFSLQKTARKNSIVPN